MPVDQPPDLSGYIATAYHRYGGMMQLSPLTVDEKKYDDTCREIDRMEGVIGAKSMSLFTAAEFIWFSRFVNKMHVFPKQPQLDHQLSDLRGLLADLERRREQR